MDLLSFREMNVLRYTGLLFLTERVEERDVHFLVKV